MAEPAARRSPLAGWAGRLAALPAAIELAEIPFTSQLNLRLAAGSPAAGRIADLLGCPLPSTPCRAASGDAQELLWLGPDEWLLVGPAGPDGERDGRITSLRAAIGVEHGSVTDVSGQRTLLELAGPGSRQLLAMGCAIDLQAATSPTGTCVQTLLAQTGVILVVADDRRPRFWLLVRSSFASYLAGWLIDAATGLAVEPQR